MDSRAITTCVNLGTFQIKGLQDLVWCIHDRQTYNQPLIVAEFGQVAKILVMTGRRIEKKRSETGAKVGGLGKLKAEEFEAVDNGFHNPLSQKTGTTKAELRNIICDRVVLTVFLDVATERM